MNPQARYFAVAMKQNVAHFYAVSPRSTADQAVAGAMWEIADVIADEQGARQASETLYRIADAVARRLPIEAVFPAPAQPAEQSATVNEGLDQIIAAMRKTIEAHGGKVEKIKIADAGPDPDAPTRAQPPTRSVLAKMARDHWFGVAFLAFYAGLVIGSALQ